MVRLALGDPARKLIGRAIRALCARGCRVTWCVHYNMDRATPAQLRRFLRRVRAAARRWAEAYCHCEERSDAAISIVCAL